MKHYKAFLVGVLATALAFTLFWAGTAYATTGCFTDTNGHGAEAFICWLKDHGIANGYPDGTFRPNNFISRGEMAIMLQRANKVPPLEGEIRINSGVNNWDILGSQTQPLTVYRWDEFIGFTSPTANSYYTFLMTPDFPSGLYRRKLSVTGMEYCYTASADVYIDQLNAWHLNETAGAGAAPIVALVSDGINRTDAACRYYSITPRAVDDNTILSVFIYVQWGPSGAGAQMKLGRVTFFFQPTDTLVVAPMGAEPNAAEELNAPEVPRPIP